MTQTPPPSPIADAERIADVLREAAKHGMKPLPEGRHSTAVEQVVMVMPSLLIAASDLLRAQCWRSIESARPLSEWHEDMGPMLWWKFPIIEPPYCGTPLDCETTIKLSVGGAIAEEYTFGGFPDYVTHFTPIPLPTEPEVTK